MSNKLGHDIKCVKGNKEYFYDPNRYFCTKCKIEFLPYQGMDDRYYPVKPRYNNLTCDEVKIHQVIES